MTAPAFAIHNKLRQKTKIDNQIQEDIKGIVKTAQSEQGVASRIDAYTSGLEGKDFDCAGEFLTKWRAGLMGHSSMRFSRPQ
jgi:hypothetical protein